MRFVSIFIILYMIKYKFIITSILLFIILGFVTNHEFYVMNISRIEHIKINQIKKLDSCIFQLQNKNETYKSRIQKSRLFFAKIEHWISYLFTDYYIKLNKPPIFRFNDDEPSFPPIKPSGFQLLEELVNDSNLDSFKIDSEIDNVTKLLCNVKKEFENYSVELPELFQGYRLHILRIASIYISGSDAPFDKDQAIIRSNYSLKQIIEECNNINPQYESHLNLYYVKAKNLYTNVNSFEKFDRYSYIKLVLIPIYRIIQQIQIQSNINFKSENSPIDNQSLDWLSDNYFNVLWFSRDQSHPPEEHSMIELGKLLFFDPLLSESKTISCATCHIPNLAFTDGKSKNIGLDGNELHRNTPTLINACLQGGQFWDNRVNFLETQIFHVIKNQQEMNGIEENIIYNLKNSPEYVKLFNKAFSYNSELSISMKNIARAIAMYERSLVKLKSPFDLSFINKRKVSKSIIKGFNLFMGKAQCGTCHFYPLFNGTVPPEFMDAESEVLGITLKLDSIHPIKDNDIGRFIKIPDSLFMNSFKTPTVRNVKFTGPYMHNGGFKTLEEVMTFYNIGGGIGLGLDIKNQTLPSERLNLSKKEIYDIINFMKSLSDTSNTNDIPSKLPGLNYLNNIPRVPVVGKVLK